MVRKLLICTDGSSCADEAFILGENLASAMSCEVTLLHVTPQLSKHYKEFVDREGKDSQSEVEATLDKCKKSLEEAKVKTEIKIREGDPANQILKESEEGEYEMLIVGSRGVGLTPLLYGSVSNKVLKHSSIPVLLVKDVPKK